MSTDPTILEDVASDLVLATRNLTAIVRGLIDCGTIPEDAADTMQLIATTDAAADAADDVEDELAEAGR